MSDSRTYDVSRDFGSVRYRILRSEICEICGQDRKFSGIYVAQALHTSSGRFVCGQCARSIVGRFWGFGSGKLDALTLERDFRFCAGCGQVVPLSEQTVEAARRRPHTCDSCAGLDPGKLAEKVHEVHEMQQQGGDWIASERVRLAKEVLRSLI